MGSTVRHVIAENTQTARGGSPALSALRRPKDHSCSVHESSASLRRGVGPCGRVRQGCRVLDSNIEQNTEAEQVNKRRAEWLMSSGWGRRAGHRLSAPPVCNTSACSALPASLARTHSLSHGSTPSPSPSLSLYLSLSLLSHSSSLWMLKTRGNIPFLFYILQGARVRCKTASILLFFDLFSALKREMQMRVINMLMICSISCFAPEEMKHGKKRSKRRKRRKSARRKTWDADVSD